MPTKKPSESEYASIGIRVDSYQASIGIGLNLNLVTNFNRGEPTDPAVTNEIGVDIFGTCTYPPKRADAKFEIQLRHSDGSSRIATLKDLHVQKDHAPVYRTTISGRVPVYKVPSGITVLQKVRGEAAWQAYISYTSPHAMNALITLLSGTKQLYMSIHEHKFERQRWIKDFSFQTRDPADEQ